MQLIDTHAHAYAAQFSEDQEEMIARAKEKGLKHILLPNIDMESYGPLMKLYNSNKGFFKPMIGLHPCDVKSDFKQVLAQMKDILLKETELFCAIGETGVDLYWDKSTEDIQIQAFEEQITWAQHTGLPIVIHARESIDLLIKTLQKPNNKGITGVFHCFTGDINQANKIVDLGFYLGIGGVLTFKNGGLSEIVNKLPLERLLLETDAPYLAPVPYRGKRNEPAYLAVICQKLAECLELSYDEVANMTTGNAKKLFNLA